jgi:AraC family transcriptional regulator
VKAETRTFYELAVQRAVEGVIDTLDGALDLEALARGAALSPFHFHRVFRGAVGETPLELHRRLRMERAAWTLLHEAAPVTAVALSAGYETHESFTRAFRAHYQCSPSEFRQTGGGGESCERPRQIELAARSGIHFEAQRSHPVRIRFSKGESIMHVDIKEMPELRVATVEHIGPYNQIGEAFARLGQIAGPAGLFGPASAMLGLYHDDPETTPSSELHSEAALVVSPDTRIPKELGERRIAGGRYASTTHVGPYEQLGDVWARLMGEWLASSGHRMADGGVTYEIYRNTPADTPKEKLVTELYVPLASQ